MQGSEQFRRDIQDAMQGQVRPRTAAGHATAGANGVSVVGSGNQITYNGTPPGAGPRRMGAWARAWCALVALFMGAHMLAGLDWAAEPAREGLVFKAWALVQNGGPEDALHAIVFGVIAGTLVIATFGAARLWWSRHTR